MTRSIRDDELTLWSSKITISNVDSNSLLALSTKSICEESKIYIFVSMLTTTNFDSFHLVFKNRFAVIK